METPLRRTRAHVDLDAVEHNVLELWRHVGTDKQLMVLLKADAYGHGAIAIARLMDRHDGVWGGVANLEEVFALRSAGVQMPLLVLEDLFEEGVEPALQMDARLTVSSVAFAGLVSRIAGERGIRARVHVNVDTGMGRLGVPVAKAEAAFAEIAKLRHLTVEGIYTHFASSDEADKQYSFHQLRLFSRLLEALSRRRIAPPLVHAANSGAVIGFPAASAFTMVRPGLAAFGLYPSPQVGRTLDLRLAMQLYSALIKVQDYPAGHSIGYGRTFVARRPTCVGIIPIGYGDGYLRALSNKAHMIVAGNRVSVIGRVSMDLTAVDLTDLPSRPLAGDTVVVFGEDVTVDELAQLSGTIAYEVVTLLTRRVPRVYHRRGSIVATQTLSRGYRELVAAASEEAQRESE